ncbi:hypothetical protein M3Y97_01037200 [Aphelenchoides bicaudatus]|nr:hypothetical protein M3Y97_01037200 [Aphelenchoides bicaudatus]
MDLIKTVVGWFNPDSCMCGTPVSAGVYIVAWMFIVCDTLVCGFVFTSRVFYNSDWLYITYLIGDNIITWVTTVLLLFGINKKLPWMYDPFLISNTGFLVIKLIRLVLVFAVSTISAMVHHFSGNRVLNYYNIFIHLNVYDIFHDKAYGIWIMFSVILINVAVTMLYGYLLTVVYRHYFALLRTSNVHSKFSSRKPLLPYDEREDPDFAGHFEKDVEQGTGDGASTSK